MACCMMGLAMLMGMAKPMPCAPPATAVLMPMTSPFASTSAPPELPGLMAASVWMRLRSERCCPVPHASSTTTSRPRALTTPLVTLVVKVPRGLPMASDSWPGLSADESPMLAAGRSGPLDLHDGEVREGVDAVGLAREAGGRPRSRRSARPHRTPRGGW